MSEGSDYGASRLRTAGALTAEKAANHTPSMVEEMARVAYEKNPSVEKGHHLLGTLAWDELKDWQRADFVKAMRAAVTAMRINVPWDFAMALTDLAASFDDHDWENFRPDTAAKFWRRAVALAALPNAHEAAEPQT